MPLYRTQLYRTTPVPVPVPILSCPGLAWPQLTGPPLSDRANRTFHLAPIRHDVSSSSIWLWIQWYEVCQSSLDMRYCWDLYIYIKMFGFLDDSAEEVSVSHASLYIEYNWGLYNLGGLSFSRFSSVGSRKKFHFHPLHFLFELHFYLFPI